VVVSARADSDRALNSAASRQGVSARAEESPHDCGSDECPRPGTLHIARVLVGGVVANRLLPGAHRRDDVSPGRGVPVGAHERRGLC